MARIRPLLITMDTEGDNLWQRPRTITTRNAAFLPRFQTLCERYGLAPTWLTDYDMGRDPFFVEFGRDVVERGAGEIGVHPHAWNTPPVYSLTGDDYAFMPYLIEYPESVLEAKLEVLTDLLETTFDAHMVSHRAGRWSFNETYAEALARRGFRVDCSVTPGVDWRATLGDPSGRGGTDYSTAPHHAYVLAVGVAPGATLWEVPVTIRPAGGRLAASVRRTIRGLAAARRLWNGLYPDARWLRPRPGNRREMQRLLGEAVRDDSPYVEFMLHSSELMPAGSPTFCDDRSIEALYDDLESIFSEARSLGFVGMTLGCYADHLDGTLGDQR